MRATAWEYRLRFPLHLLIFVLGFWPFWEPWVGLTTRSTWLVLSAEIARQGWLGFQAATVLLLALAALLTALGAWMRVWGTAYIGTGVVSAPTMHAPALQVSGPYRRTRNPLYLGTILHTVGISLLMPPAGAVFAVAAIWIFQLRLAAAEEPFLERRFGSACEAYRAKVPAFLPSPKQLPSQGHVHPQWGTAVLGEIYFVGVFVTLVAFGWDFNAQPLYRGILISLGLSLVVQAFLPRQSPSPNRAVF